MPNSKECIAYGQHHEEGDCKMCKRTADCEYHKRISSASFPGYVTDYLDAYRTLYDKTLSIKHIGGGWWKIGNSYGKYRKRKLLKMTENLRRRAT